MGCSLLTSKPNCFPLGVRPPSWEPSSRPFFSSSLHSAHCHHGGSSRGWKIILYLVLKFCLQRLTHHLIHGRHQKTHTWSTIGAQAVKCPDAVHLCLTCADLLACGLHTLGQEPANARLPAIANPLVFADSGCYCSQGLGHGTFVSLTLLPSHLIPICYQIEFPIPSLTFKPSGGLAPSAWLAWWLQVS